MDDLFIKSIVPFYQTENVQLFLGDTFAGFLGTENYIANAFGVDLNARTNVATAEGAYATNVKNVFTAGDMHRGQSLVVWAIREGREAAREVDESLMGWIRQRSIP